MKLEVVVDVHAEMIFMVKLLLISGGLLEWGMQLAISPLALITRTLYRPFEVLFNFTINTEFTRKDTFSLIRLLHW